MSNSIRINMVVTKDENPELHALLESREPKVRSAVLRQHAEFGLWMKRRNGFDIPVEPSLQTIPHSESIAKIDHHKTTKKQKKDSGASAVETGTTATVQMANAGTLDASVLEGVDLGELD